MEQLNNEQPKTIIPIKEQITKAMSNSELSHFWHIESQTLLSFSDTDEAADEYNDQIEASPEDYLQILSDRSINEQVLAEKFIAENGKNNASDWSEKSVNEIFEEAPNLAADWTAYREQFYGKLADTWLTENGLLG